MEKKEHRKNTNKKYAFSQKIPKKRGWERVREVILS